MTMFTAETLEIELTAGVWTDITEHLKMSAAPLRIRQGRATENDEMSPGVCTFTLSNHDGRFMPGNAASPLYPNFAKGKRIRWRVTKGATTYTRFVGPIQAIEPSFPATATARCVVAVTAIDSLGILSQRKMRSNLTEISLWRARADGSWCDAYEAVGVTSGMYSQLTNLSNDASPGAPGVLYSATDAALSFGSENDLSAGDIVTAGGTQTTKTLMGLQGNPLQIKWHLKGPSSLVDTGIYQCAYIQAIGGLAVTLNAGANGLFLRNAANTANVAFLGNIPRGQWVEVIAYSRAVNPARSDWFLIYTDGAATGAVDVAVDIRSATTVWFPGNSTPALECSISGVVALGTRSPINWQEAVTGVPNGTAANRIASLASSVNALPVTILTIGTLTGAVSTGRWSGLSAFEVLQEITRTHSGLVWARSRDSTVYAIGSDTLYPTTPAATLDVDADCVGTPRLVDGTEAQPTRIEVDWPGGTTLVRDAAAEATGISRSRRIATVASSAATAAAAGQAILARAVGGMRISQFEIDLTGPVADPTASLFSESTTLGGLYPTQRLRLAVPASHFGTPTKDVHVQGWEELYTPDRVTLRLDTTPAIASTIVGPLTFTAADGSGLPGSWDVLLGAGTTAVQSNRARETTAASASGVHYVRSGVAWAEGEMVATVIPGTGSKAVIVVREVGAGAGGTGYRVVLNTVANQLAVQREVTPVATVGMTLTAGTAYKVRIRTLGAWTNVRVWAAAGAEPGTWDIAYVDPSPLAGTRWMIGCWADGTNAVARSADFDDITVTTGT